MHDLTRPALARLAAGALLGHVPPGRGDFMAWAEERASAVLAARNGTLAPRVSWTDEALAAAEAGQAPYEVASGVAVVKVKGLIVPELGLVGWSWATGCAELCWQIEHAMGNPDVAGVALLVDSYGGYVAGVDTAAAVIRAARAVKPVLAAVEDSAFSAAYYLASAADQISAPRSGGVGHIGTIAMHVDYSRALANSGITATVLHSGARKADGSPYAPLSDAARTDIQARLDAQRRVFAESVAEGRRGAVTADALLSTEARAFDGPDGIEEALSLGLIDAVMPAHEAIGLFATHLAGAAG